MKNFSLSLFPGASVALPNDSFYIVTKVKVRLMGVNVQQSIGGQWEDDPQAAKLHTRQLRSITDNNSASLLSIILMDQD